MNMITIGTDCSGIEAPIEALKQLGVPYQHKWSCEIDNAARQSIMVNHPPEIMYEDITKRDHAQLPGVDIYVCGFPCQAFSLMGKKRGTNDPRSNIMLHCIDVIKKKRPPVFILENVKNFKFIEKGRPFKCLMEHLRNILDENGEPIYNIYADIYNTKDYGIPQNRERIYIIGISHSVLLTDYVKPAPTPCARLADFVIDTNIRLLSSNDQMLIRNLKMFSGVQENNIITPFTFYHPMHNCSPTLTTRCGSFYHTLYNRTLSPVECLMLQGFRHNFKIVVSKTQICKQAGNSMSVNVLKVILKEVFASTMLLELI